MHCYVTVSALIMFSFTTLQICLGLFHLMKSEFVYNIFKFKKPKFATKLTHDLHDKIPVHQMNITIDHFDFKQSQKKAGWILRFSEY